MSLIYLSSGPHLRNFRKEQYDKQNGVCPILKQWVPFEDTVVDHQHANKGSVAGVDNAYMVRGIIQNGCNAAEGKMYSTYKRMGLRKLISFPEFLRNLADYIDSPPLFGSEVVHPEGKPKMLTFGKREFNRLIKYWPMMYPKRKAPVWKDKGRNGKTTGKMNLTKNFDKWIKEADELHYGRYATPK